MSVSIPAVVENHLDAIHCMEDGKILLSSSNLTGRYWNGSLWCFKNEDDAPDVEKCLSGIDASAGISDFIFTKTNLAILGLDSGGLDVFRYENSPSSGANCFSWCCGACEHDDFISSLAPSCDSKNLVTVGSDKCVKIWDMEAWSTSATYRPVHGGRIWQVTCSATDPNVFLTCGQDGKILMFDLRLPKPATSLDTSSLKGEPTSLSWKPDSESVFAAGDESGLIALKDIRQSGSISSWQPHRRRVFRILFAKSEPLIASCADDTNVCVFNIQESNAVKIYEDNRHEDFVRGLAWNPNNELISCGWDKRVLKHTCAESD